MDGLDESSLLKARLLDAELRIAMLEGAILANHKAMKGIGARIGWVA